MVYRVAKGKLSAACPLPPIREGDTDRVLEGGLPPVAYRSATSRWMTASKLSYRLKK